MASTSVRDILTVARAKMSLIATSRISTEYFLEHRTNQKFDKTPVAGRDGFEIVARGIILTSAFGVLGQKEGEFKMVVRLGHCPGGKDFTRENNLAQDITRISDIFEAYGSWPAGTQTVIYESAETNKEDENWWLTEMFFKVVYIGDIQS